MSLGVSQKLITVSEEGVAPIISWEQLVARVNLVELGDKLVDGLGLLLWSGAIFDGRDDMGDINILVFERSEIERRQKVGDNLEVWPSSRDFMN